MAAVFAGGTDTAFLGVNATGRRIVRRGPYGCGDERFFGRNQRQLVSGGWIGVAQRLIRVVLGGGNPPRMCVCVGRVPRRRLGRSEGCDTNHRPLTVVAQSAAQRWRRVHWRPNKKPTPISVGQQCPRVAGGGFVVVRNAARTQARCGVRGGLGGSGRGQSRRRFHRH